MNDRKNALKNEFLEIARSARDQARNGLEAGEVLYRKETMKYSSLEEIRNAMGDCTRCKLHSTRTKLVFGTGNPKPELVFVGEAPGADEDLKGEPFVGRAGQLLTRMIEAMGLNRNMVFITNIIKSRPPGNRNPEPDEILACLPFLIAQLEVLKPKVICALGSFAAQTLLQTEEKISKLRGRFHDYRGIKLMPTYHPAYLLRNPVEKKAVWEDMQMIMKELHIEPETSKTRKDG